MKHNYKNSFDIKVLETKNKEQEVSSLNDIRRMHNGVAKMTNVDGDAIQPGVWVTFEKDMKFFTQTRPDIVVQVTRRGEDPEDANRYYFKNGKVLELKPTNTPGAPEIEPAYEEYGEEIIKQLGDR